MPRNAFWSAALAMLFIAEPVRAENPGVHKYEPSEGLTVSKPGSYGLTLSGYLQPAAESLNYLGSGPEGANQRFRIRRARLRLDGSAPPQRLRFRLQIDLTGNSETGDPTDSLLLDAFVSYNFTRTLKLTFGQRPTFTDNRELVMRSHTLQFIERSRVTSAFAAIREFGFFLEDRIRVGQSQHYIRPYLIVTNGDGENAFLDDRGGLKYGGRIDYLPFGLFSNKGQFRQVDIVRELTPKLVVGTAYSYNVGVSSRRGRGSGDIIYLNDNDEESLPDFGKLSVDFLFKYAGFSALGEFNYTHANVPDDITQRVRDDGSISRSFEGGVENYVKRRMMLGKGYNLQLGYIFDFGTSFDVRYTNLDADENSFLNNGTFYNRPNYYTAGVSHHFFNDYSAKIQASVTYVDANEGTNDFFGEPTDGDELIVRAQTTFAF